MITLMWVALGIFTVLVLAAIGVCVWALIRDRRQERADDAGLIVDAATVMDIDMTMPPEIAHDDPFTPLTSPARIHTPAAPAGEGLGHAAAAASNATPPASPPPLPADDIAALVRSAIDTPGCEPFPVWQLDEFVEAYNAAQGDAS